MAQALMAVVFSALQEQLSYFRKIFRKNSLFLHVSSRTKKITNEMLDSRCLRFCDCETTTTILLL